MATKTKRKSAASRVKAKAKTRAKSAAKSARKATKTKAKGARRAARRTKDKAATETGGILSTLKTLVTG